jgi:predicted SAM-dependent methyltransferase
MIPQFVRAIKHPFREVTLRKQLKSRPLRVVIGASGVFEPGWVATNRGEFDLLRPESWHRYVEPDSIDVLLAEHVWEHLSMEEGTRAASLCYRFLKSGGYIRVAVPDGFFPDPAYQDYIKVGGSAGGQTGGHKVVYTYDQLARVFESAGFRTTLLEYHDASGVFHRHDWLPADGMIHRSERFDKRGPVSVILDALK